MLLLGIKQVEDNAFGVWTPTFQSTSQVLLCFPCSCEPMNPRIEISYCLTDEFPLLFPLLLPFTAFFPFVRCNFILFLRPLYQLSQLGYHTTVTYASS